METTFSPGAAMGAVVVAVLYIAIFSWVKEPYRQKINALLIAGAGATYWSGGFGYWEFPLGPVMIFLAYKGLQDYRYLALGWMVHTAFDWMHHLWGHPIIPMEPSSSAGCGIADPIMALWLYAGAPSIWRLFSGIASRPASPG
jgi:Family of unknown function (DUF6010)